MDCLDQIIAREGGLTEDPADPGGLTNFGISQRAFPHVDIRALTPETAKALYNEHYLRRTHIIDIPDEQLRCQMLDWAVHSGPAVPIRALQHILDVPQDGLLGDGTLSALAERDGKDVNNRLAFYRIAFLYDLVRGHPKLAKFKKGWIARAQSFLLT